MPESALLPLQPINSYRWSASKRLCVLDFSDDRLAHVCTHLSKVTGGGSDLLHRPVQVAEPQWSSMFCTDPAQSRATRFAFMEQHADSDRLILAAHFPEPGRIVRGGNGFRFEAAL